MRGALSIILSTLLVAVAAAPAALAHGPPVDESCGDGAAGVTVTTLTIASGGEDVTACLAEPDAGAVDTLVVFAHGLGHTVQKDWLHHLDRTVLENQGVAAVAMNYRDNFGFPAMQGAEDLVRTTLAVEADIGTIKEIVLLGVSMGGAISGTAVHIAPSMNGGDGLFDHWVDVEGVTNLFETYAEAKAAGLVVPFAADVAEGIERDAGGTPADAPQAYVDRSPALNADAMAAAGLQSATIVHAVNDGLVPYDQAREMAVAAVAAGIPTELNTILRGPADHTAGTTPTKHAYDAGAPGEDPNEQHLHLAGHASEGDAEHIVMEVAFDRLFAILDGDAPTRAYAEHVIDAELGSVGTG